MDRITEVDNLIKRMFELLPCIYDENISDEYKYSHFTINPDGDVLLSGDQNEIDTLANFFDALYGEGTVETGYYDPEEDEIIDAYTGLYFLYIGSR